MKGASDRTLEAEALPPTRSSALCRNRCLDRKKRFARKNHCVADGLSLDNESVEEIDDIECDVAFTYDDVMFLQNQNDKMELEISEDVWMTEMQKDEILLKVTEIRDWYRSKKAYQAIMAESFNDLGAHLVYDKNRIMSAHDEYVGLAWKDYDKEFRGVKANRPTLG
ncbi:hypothetical protein NDU88_004928 [Pleurodeles waltl]|uniref:Uncharacterized protein n=1 Tax=Pleurodeles waltl TaxID=8319 RepID=A0AAV7WVR6_PLEWA|nr:hypothetical protein NDU88_004928 [Pleurodeles waltl]